MDSPGTLIARFYGGTFGPTVVLTYPTPLQANRPITMHIHIRNDGTEELRIHSLVVSQTALARTADGFTTNGSPTVLADINLNNISLAPGKSQDVTTTLTFTGTGATELAVAIESSGNMQPYNGQYTFVLELP